MHCIVRGGKRIGSGRPLEIDKRMNKTLRFTETEWKAITEKAKYRGFKNKRAQYLVKLMEDDKI